jgi:hypothetical protein
MTILALIKELLSELVGLVRGINSSRDKSNFRGDIMYIVKADHPEIGFNLSFTVTDSEGNVVPDSSLIVMVESDNEDAVDITVDETGRAGTVMFGNPGLANVNATVESEEGVLLGSFGAQFTVTVGDPAAIVGGALVFEGLTETIEPAPPVELEPVVVPEVPVV